MRNKYILILFLIGLFGNVLAQDIPIGEWRDHLPYSNAVSVSYGNNTVYCATNSALFLYDQSEFTIDRLSLVNGLSDIGLSKIKFNPYNQRLIIAYTNGNLDVIDENKNITNLSFIKNSSILSDKIINHIYLEGKLAYLSTGFGIVILDTDKLEIVDTYLFGPLGSFVYTNAMTIDSFNIYAATDQGIYYADKNSTTLVDYNNWTLLPDLGTNNYSNIVTFNGKVFVSSESTTIGGDTLYYNNNGLWQKFLPNGYDLISLNASSAHLYVSNLTLVEKYNTALALEETVSSYKGKFTLNPKEVTIDGDGFMLIAEQSHGIIRAKSNWESEKIMPNSPSSANVFGLDFENDELWVVSGGYNESDFTSGGNTQNLFNHKVAGVWASFPNSTTGTRGTVTDAAVVEIDPNNSSHVFIGTWDAGLLEINNNVVSHIYTAQNSVLDSTFFGSTRIGALAYDAQNNLWVSSSFSNSPLAVKLNDNSWYNFSFAGIFNATNVFSHLIVDKNNYKWLVEPRAKTLLVFDDNNTADNTSDDRIVTNSNVPGSKIHSIAEDLDGEIWVGTDEGIGVFYNPSTVFDNDIEAQEIYVQQDGQTQILLKTEVVTVITVDGANRKWLGTQNSGVFLMSEDGTEEIEHFTTENSPLFSNTIFAITINPTTGEVFFGTEKGLLSYKGTATAPDSDFNNVFVYPNPVKPDFNGSIAIRGLVSNTDVRITDISGNIVYQTTSFGGQAIWDGKDFNGNKVQTGVYMIFNASPEGELKAAAKILFIH